MEQGRRPSKAAGNSDLYEDPYHHNASVSRPRRASQRSPTGEEQPEASSLYSSSQGRRPTLSGRNSRRMSAFNQDQINAATPEQGSQESSIADNDDWDIINRPEQVASSTNPQNTPQSYDFPGTWPAAINDTKFAMSHVGSATASYASALTQSGIGRAGWSISSALATTASNHAYSMASWAADRTGTGLDQLPRPIKWWMKDRKQREDDAKRAKARRLRQRGIGDGNGQPMFSEPQAFGDGQGAFTLHQHEMDSTGEFVEHRAGVLQIVDAPGRSQGGWHEETMKGSFGEEGEDVKEPGDDDEIEEDEPVRDDGMLRLFQYDD